MKTIAIIAAILISTTALAAPSGSKKTLTVRDSFGRVLCMPVKTEEAVEELPFDQQEVFNQFRSERTTRIFDISGMSQPEAFVDDIPSELRHLIVK